MGLVGGETAALTAGGCALEDVAAGTLSAGRLLDSSVRACAAALDGEVAAELGRFAVATSVFTDALATHVRATGFLAQGIGADLDRADGR